MTKPSPRLSIVVPCFNEEECLDTLHARITAAARSVVTDDYELIFVNDGSRDETWRVMTELASVDKHLLAVDLSRNHGHQLALTAGLDICRGQLIFVVDADLQDPPELLLPMLEVMEQEDADVVYGVRTERVKESGFKRFTANAFYRLLRRATEIDIPLDAGDFRLMTRRALNVFLSMPESARFVRGMVAWGGFRQVPFPYRREGRFAGESHYPISKMVRLAFDALTSFSSAPLKLASHAGIALSFGSLLLMIYILSGWLSGRAVAGWTSLMAVVVGLGSIQMFVLGMIGEYLGRLYNQAKARPLYIIQNIVGGDIERTRLGINASTICPLPVQKKSNYRNK